MQKFINKFSVRRLETLLKLLIGSLILGVPLYPKFPFIRVPGTYVSIRLEDFLILIVVVVWLILVIPQLRKLLKDDIIQSILLFFVIGLISVLSAAFITQTVTLNIALFHWARRIEYMICFAIGITAIKSEKDLKFFLNCLFVVVIYACLYGIAQKYFALPIITTQNFEYSKGLALRFMPGGHMVSTFAGHYDLASFLVMALPILFALLFTKFYQEGRGKKLTNMLVQNGILLVIIGGGFWLLLQTVSRISIASYFVAVTITLLLIKKYRYLVLVWITSIVLIASSTSLIDRYTRIFEVYVQKLISTVDQITPSYSVYAQDEPLKVPKSTIISPSPMATPAPAVFEDRSTSIRLNVEWPRAIRALTKNPLLGTGYSSITLATDNDYLRKLGEVGILGFLSFGLILIKLARRYLYAFFKLSKGTLSKAYLAAVMGFSAGVLVNAVFIDVFEASKFAILFWLFSGFAVGTIRVADSIKAHDKKVI